MRSKKVFFLFIKYKVKQICQFKCSKNGWVNLIIKKINDKDNKNNILKHFITRIIMSKIVRWYFGVQENKTGISINLKRMAEICLHFFIGKYHCFSALGVPQFLSFFPPSLAASPLPFLSHLLLSLLTCTH